MINILNLGLIQWKSTRLNSKHYQNCCSAAQSCLNLCYLMDYSMPGFPILRHLLELVQVHVHCLGDAIQPSPHQSPLSTPAFSIFQHQGLFQ